MSDGIKIDRVSQLSPGDRMKFVEDFPVPDTLMPADYEHTIPAGTEGVVVAIYPKNELVKVKVEVGGKTLDVLIYEESSTRSLDKRNRLDRIRKL